MTFPMRNVPEIIARTQKYSTVRPKSVNGVISYSYQILHTG